MQAGGAAGRQMGMLAASPPTARGCGGWGEGVWGRRAETSVGFLHPSDGVGVGTQSVVGRHCQMVRHSVSVGKQDGRAELS